jgi:hypothetical protein
MQRRDNSSGSVGYWWQGPKDQMYGRYSRGFAHPQSTIEMVLDQGLWGGLPLTASRAHLTLRLVFLDNSVGQFFVGYDALDGPRGWVVDTKGTSRWREVTFAINNGRFARVGPNGADVWLRDMSQCITWSAADCAQKPTLFDSLEVVEMASDESLVDPVHLAVEDLHMLPASPAPLMLAASAPCHWGDDHAGVPCAEYAKQGECKHSPEFMQEKCAASCGCSAPNVTRLAQLEAALPASHLKTPTMVYAPLTTQPSVPATTEIKAPVYAPYAPIHLKTPAYAPAGIQPVYAPTSTSPTAKIWRQPAEHEAPHVPVRLTITDRELWRQPDDVVETPPSAALATTDGCTDSTEVPCASWAARGECEHIPVYMHTNCAASCGCPTSQSAASERLISAQSIIGDTTILKEVDAAMVDAASTVDEASSTKPTLGDTAGELTHTLRPSRRKSTFLWRRSGALVPEGGEPESHVDTDGRSR